MLSELETRLNLLELKCRRPVEHLLAGEYRSVFRGRGIEFEDVRAYQPGDDVRAMDWKVTARTGKPHIKRHIEEREQHVYLLVDLSASMLHGAAGRKRATMAEACSLITMAATRNQDRVGLVLFTDAMEQVVPPGKGRSHALRIMDELVNHQPLGRGTDLVGMLGSFGHMARKRSIVFVVSDFLTTGYARELQALAVRHDVNAIHMCDDESAGAGFSGLMRVEDAESGVQRVVELAGRADEAAEHFRRLSAGMLESGVSLLDLPAGADCVEALAGFFQARQRQVLNETGG